MAKKESATESPAAQVNSSLAKPIKVWLVDDSDNFRTLLAELLQAEEGLNCCQQFRSAEALLETLPGVTPPDVILLDIRMPGMGGLEAVHHIKAIARSVQVLMLTTFYDGAARNRALSDGASALLLKSFKIGEIADYVRRAHVERAPLAVAYSPGETRELTTRELLGDSLSDWPNHRASERNHGQTGNRHAKILHPESGHRRWSWRWTVDRLVRGIGSLRTLFGLPEGQARPAGRQQALEPSS